MIVYFYFIILALVCIFVPWRGDMPPQVGSGRPCGYAPVWSPPGGCHPTPTVDIERLVLEIVAVTALGIAVLLLTGSFKKYLD